MENIVTHPHPGLRLQLSVAPACEKRIEVLLVEDDPALRRSLKRTLKSLGYAVREAGTLKEAKAAALAGGLVTLVLSDYHLPDGTGLDLLEWLVQEVHTDPPFILMSGEYLSTLNVVGDFLFLPKPFSSTQLKDLLDQTRVLHSIHGGLSAHSTSATDLLDPLDSAPGFMTSGCSGEGSQARPLEVFPLGRCVPEDTLSMSPGAGAELPPVWSPSMTLRAVVQGLDGGSMGILTILGPGDVQYREVLTGTGS